VLLPGSQLERLSRWFPKGSSHSGLSEMNNQGRVWKSFAQFIRYSQLFHIHWGNYPQASADYEHEINKVMLSE